MTRTLTASIAFAATLGLAGLAQAQTVTTQTYDGKQNYETPGKPSAGYQAAPSVATSPALPTRSDPYTRTYAPGTTAKTEPSTNQ